MQWQTIRNAVVVGLALCGTARAEPACTRDAMVVFDGSGSMGEMGFNRLWSPRILDAREAVRRVLPEIAPLRRLGLITYGPGAGASCDNVVLRFSPLPDAADRMITEIDALEPEGETPLTAAVARAARVLSEDGAPGIVVLVTDGRETCGGAPCDLAARLATEGTVVHVIGFRVRGVHFVWPGEGAAEQEYQQGRTVARCLADQTGGLYVSANTVEQLIGALRQTLGCYEISALRPSEPAARRAAP